MKERTHHKPPVSLSIRSKFWDGSGFFFGCMLASLCLKLIHQFFRLQKSFSNRFRFYFIRQKTGSRQRFIMIFKECNILKPISSDKIHQSLKVLVRLPREPNNKIRPHKTLRKMPFNKIEQLQGHLMIVKSPHCLENFRRCMLERKIKIRDKLFEFGEPLEMLFRKQIWIEIQHPIVKIPLQHINSFQKFKKLTLSIQIDSIPCTILGDQDQLPHPRSNQIASLCNHRL